MTDRLSLRQNAPRTPSPPPPPPPPPPEPERRGFFGNLQEKVIRQLDDAREVLTVRRRAETALADPTVSQPTGGGAYREIRRDAYDVNDALGRKDAAAAEAQVKRNQPLVSSRLESLSPEDRARYERVGGLVKEDPAARLSMQVLLLEGRLTGERASDGKSLLETIDGIGAQDMHGEIDREALVGELTRELALPSAINQHNRGTCTVTSFQIAMAKERPAEYARVVGQLATPGGEATLANGDKVRREPGTETDDDTDRSIPSRLWQPALMEYANGDQSYDNATGEHSDGSEGLDAKEIGKVMEAVLDQDVDTMQASGGVGGFFGQMLPGHDTKGDLANRVREEVQDNPVLVGLQWGEPDADGKIHGGHKVLVTRIDDDTVYYDNPWGKQESMSYKEFEDRLKNANFADY